MEGEESWVFGVILIKAWWLIDRVGSLGGGLCKESMETKDVYYQMRK